MGFFLVRGIGKGAKALEIMGIGVLIFYLFAFTIYSTQAPRVKSGYANAILIMLIGIILSTLACSYIYNQSMIVTLYQQRSVYFLLFYFLLPYLFPSTEWLKTLIIYLGVAAGVIYILQYFAYPLRITEAKMFVDRGTLRINLPGTAFMHLAYFMFLDNYFKTSKLKYGAGVILLLITAVLSGFRSIVAIYILISGIYLLASKQTKNKFIIIFVAICVVIASFFAFQGIIKEMQSSAQRETSQGTDYIRVRAASYFLREMSNHEITYITGNGQSSERSEYGRKIARISYFYGYYLSDIGIIGTFYKYGILFVLPGLIVFFKIAFMKLPLDFQFIKLFIIMQILTVLLSSIIEGGEGAIVLCLVLYLVDRSQEPVYEGSNTEEISEHIKN
jgi:hypothetical protein